MAIKQNNRARSLFYTSTKSRCCPKKETSDNKKKKPRKEICFVPPYNRVAARKEKETTQ